MCISSYHMPYFVILRYLNRIIVLPKIEEVRGLEEFKQWVAKDHPPLGLSIFNSIFCLFHTIFFNLISQCWFKKDSPLLYRSNASFSLLFPPKLRRARFTRSILISPNGILVLWIRNIYHITRINIDPSVNVIIGSRGCVNRAVSLPVIIYC